MSFPHRSVALIAAALLSCACALPANAATARPRVIAIAVNGEDLARDPAPRMVGGRLMVPVVRIFNALGIDVTRSGDDVFAAAPAKRIVLHIGSARAEIDQRAVALEGPVREIEGATYVPLRFVADALGAYVTYDAKAARVDVVSSLVGRNPGLEQHTAQGLQLNGTVTAVDLASAPESISVSGRNGDERTISITSDARILLQDTVARTSTNGTLADVRPGDAVSIVLRRDGRVADIDVRYATRSGAIAAASGNSFVLRDGFVVTPDRSTLITLDGQPAHVGDLRPGDAVTVRINPDTLEKRQIAATRSGPVPPSAAPSPAASAPRILTVSTGTARAYRGGDTLPVTLTGTPGGRATFDVGAVAAAQPMTETKPGTYSGTWAIPAGADLGTVAVVGHLTLAGADAPKVAARDLAIVSSPPQILETAPKAGEVVNNDKPSVFATFRSPTGVAIDPASVSITIDGKDVTAAATRTDGFVTYSPAAPIPQGTVTVVVTVADVARNTTTKTWTFTIRTH